MSELATYEAPKPVLLRPIAPISELLENNAQMTEVITGYLKDGTDYGIVPGTGKTDANGKATGKHTLFKAGAERLAVCFGLVVDYEIVESETDHDRVVPYLKRSKVWNNAYKGDKTFEWAETQGTSLGLYRYVIRAIFRNRANSEVMGYGLGSCSTLESKYADRPRDCENTVLKMAYKRALVAGALNVFGLSDRFNQDLEDVVANQRVEEVQEADYVEDVPWLRRTGLVNTDENREAVTYMKALGFDAAWLNILKAKAKAQEVDWRYVLLHCKYNVPPISSPVEVIRVLDPEFVPKESSVPSAEATQASAAVTPTSEPVTPQKASVDAQRPLDPALSKPVPEGKSAFGYVPKGWPEAKAWLDKATPEEKDAAMASAKMHFGDDSAKALVSVIRAYGRKDEECGKRAAMILGRDFMENASAASLQLLDDELTAMREAVANV